MRRASRSPRGHYIADAGTAAKFQVDPLGKLFQRFTLPVKDDQTIQLWYVPKAITARSQKVRKQALRRNGLIACRQQWRGHHRAKYPLEGQHSQETEQLQERRPGLFMAG